MPSTVEGQALTKEVIMNKTKQTGLSYEEACNAYFAWADEQPGNSATPNAGISASRDGLWHLADVNGSLVAVTSEGQVVASGEFFAVYERLSKEGKCDIAGGMEYLRVLREWIEDGQPDDLDEFIYRRANIGPYEE